MDDYLLHPAEARTVEDIAVFHDQVARLHERAARLQDERTCDLAANGASEESALSVELAARARDLAAVERARADQVWARHAEMTARLQQPGH